ncbi:hypothetical protein C2G38_2194614 [Gigaspora rosea]|uniref:HCP-like protein n=1 Tax=Gigaspora rosea TaxID=44941 RepID=A0A397UWI4_9GLOM|nr:hypothetical protein C2G38_2194614 [Gigaspora rosea]
MNQLILSGINKLVDKFLKGIGIKKDKHGNAAGTCNVGNCYYYGIGVERDLCKAFAYYQKPAEIGDAAGTCNVGFCYNYGIEFETNMRKAHMYYQKAAKMGDIFALVGYCYENKIGVKKNGRKAFKYYQKSADMGEVQETNNAGHCYENGIGVERDIQEIANKFKFNPSRWLYSEIKSEVNNHTCLPFNTGYYYHYGNGVKKNERKAFKYYKQSAEMGYADGMYCVSEFYQKGLIVEKNIEVI